MSKKKTNKIKSTFELIINNQTFIVSSLEEGERKLRSYTNSDFEHNYLVRKDYDNKGNLVETWLIG